MIYSYPSVRRAAGVCPVAPQGDRGKGRDLRRGGGTVPGTANQKPADLADELSPLELRAAVPFDPVESAPHVAERIPPAVSGAAPRAPPRHRGRRYDHTFLHGNAFFRKPRPTPAGAPQAGSARLPTWSAPDRCGAGLGGTCQALHSRRRRRAGRGG